MKKILVLFVFLTVAVACSTEPPAKPTVANGNKAPATNMTATLSEADTIAKEKTTWDALKKKDYEAFANMLDGNYLEISGDGMFDKAGIVAYVKDLTITDTTYSDWKLLPIDKDAVILMYQVTIKGTFKNQAIPPGPYRVSSAWVNRDGTWQAAFYQETLAKAAPPAPAPMGNPAAGNTMSPAAKGAAIVTGPDVEANEKMVWDAIKNKNFEGFGSVLAADFAEVEADGFYDKAGSVKAVSMFDGSKFELSDWKTTKLDTDALLVTYLVTMPGAKTTRERHSTIWANRSGKWLAIFHQGTPVEAVAPVAAKPPSK